MVGAAVLLVLGLVALNAIAFMHARAMLSFTSPVAPKTQNPEQLSFAHKLGVLLKGIDNPRPSDAERPDAYGLRAESRHIPVAAGITLGAWLVPGTDPHKNVIFLHGYTASKSQLLPEAQAFHARGFNLLLLDFRGSADSSERYTTVGYAEADDVRAAIDYARTELGFSDPVIYARSMGAAAVLRAASLTKLPVRALILEGVYDTMLNTVKQRFYSMGIPATPFAQLLVFWGGLQHGFWAFRHNPRSYARACTLPVLMLHGEEDPRATLSQARTVFEALAGPKRLQVFPGAGHEGLAAFDKARWEAAVDELLASVAPT